MKILRVPSLNKLINMRFVTPQSGDCFINGSEYFTKQREELYDTQKLIAEGLLYSFSKFSHTKIFTHHEWYSKFFHVHTKFETTTFHLKITRKKNKFTNQYFIFLDQSNATKEDVMSCLICSRIIALRVITFIEPYEDYVQSKHFKTSPEPFENNTRILKTMKYKWKFIT